MSTGDTSGYQLLKGCVPVLQLDSKGRLPLGAKFKQVLGDRAIMFKDEHPCFNIYPTERFSEYEARLRKLAETNGTAQLPHYAHGALRDYLREVYSFYAEVDVDDQCRITVPKYLRDTGLLEGPLTLRSTGYFLEIWRIEDLGKYLQEKRTSEMWGGAEGWPQSPASPPAPLD
ncbi:MAG: hypothetical protein B1H03_05195 [Planctomycetales bacterium 4484_113]|nr:MAG: hypothetical protein B1H03_05195 [Planctomycetales bacterium 4484_113]